MANLHEITTQRQGISLGPIKITRTFDKFPGASSALVLVSDSSVSAPVGLKIWGAASNNAFREGMEITIKAMGPKGKIEYKEYKGKWELNANECAVIIDGAADAHTTAQQGSTPTPAPSSSSGRHSQEDVANSTCNIGDLIVKGYEARGYTRSEAVQLACMPAHWALNWFGDASKPMR